MVLKEQSAIVIAAAATQGDSRLSHAAVARRAFEISLTTDAPPEGNWAEAESQLRAELAAQLREGNATRRPRRP